MASPARPWHGHLPDVQVSGLLCLHQIEGLGRRDDARHSARDHAVPEPVPGLCGRGWGGEVRDSAVRAALRASRPPHEHPSLPRHDPRKLKHAYPAPNARPDIRASSEPRNSCASYANSTWRLPPVSGARSRGRGSESPIGWYGAWVGSSAFLGYGPWQGSLEQLCPRLFAKRYDACGHCNAPHDETADFHVSLPGTHSTKHKHQVGLWAEQKCIPRCCTQTHRCKDITL